MRHRQWGGSITLQLAVRWLLPSSWKQLPSRFTFRRPRATPPRPGGTSALAVRDILPAPRRPRLQPLHVDRACSGRVSVACDETSPVVEREAYADALLGGYRCPGTAPCTTRETAR